jgi:hypothetical protein
VIDEETGLIEFFHQNEILTFLIGFISMNENIKYFCKTPNIFLVMTWQS